MLTAENLIRLLVLDEGCQILALDEMRALHGMGTREAAEANAVRAPSAVSIIPLHGAVSNRGLYGMEGFRARLGQAAENPDVGAIVLDINSPGGTVAGTPESAAAVRAAQGVKPVTAVVDSLAASAAYWIAAQAGQVVVTPSSEVGSIGVLAVHMDMSKMLEDMGMKPTIIRSTKYKAEGNPFEPLDDEGLANFQGDVDAAHADFIRAVAQGRKTSMANVTENFGQGRTVGAAEAVKRGMADRVGSMADVLSGMRTKHAFRRRSAMVFV